MPNFSPHHHVARLRCLAAAGRCEELISLGKPVADGCRGMLVACARMCALAAEELRLGSAYSRQVCALCAVLCRACGEECRAQNGGRFARCAEVCEEAAQACRATALET